MNGGIKIYGTFDCRASDNKLAKSNQIFDEEKNRFQSSINEDAVKAKIIADKAAADIGVDNITLLIGGINPDGSENTSSTYLHTGRYSTFKLEVNDGYTIGHLAQYDFAGNFIDLHNDYTQPLEGVEWTSQSVVAIDKNYYWVAIVFKGNSSTIDISPSEDVIKTFISGLYYYMQGKENDMNSAAAQAKGIVNETVEPLISRILKLEQDVFPLEVSLTISPSGAQEFTGANRDFTISWTVKIASEQVVPSKLELKVGTDYVPVDIGDISKVVSANNDKQVMLLVEAEGRSATKTANINFARCYYSAVVDSTWAATNDTIKALAKRALKSAAAATVTYSAAKQKKIVFAYPVSHGVMSTIQDARKNDMFVLNDGNKTFNAAPKTVAVTLSGGATLDYYVYESAITNVTAGNITYTTETFD